MAKRYTDSEIWIRQRWFKKLSKDYKLVFFYIKDMCDNIGIWKVDCVDLMEAVDIEDFDLNKFIDCCNQEFDKITGKPVKKVRLKLINDSELWLTNFVQFQYESKDTGKVNHQHIIGGPALEKLKKKGLYQDAIKNKYLYVNQ